MHAEHSRRGRSLLVMVTFLALALQALKLGSRGLLMHRWPTGGQWGQLALVVWLLISLWEGQAWARITAAVYYSIVAVVGGGFLFLVWWRLEPSIRSVSLGITLLAAVTAAVLWFSTDLRAYLAAKARAASGGPSDGHSSAGPLP